MKKLVLVFSFLVVTSFVFSQNLLLNPGFEDWDDNGSGGPPDDWSLSGSSMTATQEATTIHGGTYSANITWTTSSTRWLEQDVTVTAGSGYEFNFWVYDNDPDGRARVVIRWYDSGDGFLSGYYGDYSSDSASWQQLTSGVQQAPANAAYAEAAIRIYDVSGWDGSATVYVDDAIFQEESSNPISRAYTLSSSRMDVVYSTSVTSVDPSDYTLTGTSTITFTTAAIDGTDDRIVHLTGGSPAMSADLTMDNIDDTSENLDFYAGIMPISNSNTNNPTRATMLDDYDATFTGIVSANDGYNNVWISDATGAYNGVMIYDSSFDALVSVGDEITLAARRDVYSGLTELVDPVLLTIVSFGNSPYGPDTIIGENIEESLNVDTNPGESWEGQLVTIEDVYVESSGSYYYRCTDDSGENYFYIGDNVDYHFGSITMNVGTTYPSVTGVVDWYNSGPYYRLNPRSQDDIVDPPTAVTLSEFTAQYASGELSLYWTTQSEVANAGWNIYRGESEISHQNDETDQINPTLIPGSGTTSEPTDYVFVDDYEVTEGATYWYWIESRNNSGETETFGPISLTIPVEGEDPDDPSNDNYGLFQNYPNPVSNATTISFNLTEEKACKLSIYNTKGQTIKDIYEGSTAGNSFVWDRTDNFGNAVASGIYFYKLEAGSEVYTKKLVVTE